MNKKLKAFGFSLIIILVMIFTLYAMGYPILKIIFMKVGG